MKDSFNKNTFLNNMEDFIFRSVSPNGIQKVRKIRGSSFSNAKDKALEKFNRIKYAAKGNVVNYLTQRQSTIINVSRKLKKMDLVTAINRAKKASKGAKPYYITVDEDGECSVGSAPIGNPTHKFINGEEDKTFKGTKPSNTSEVNAGAPQQATASSNKKVMAEKSGKKKASKKVVAKKASKKSASGGRVINWVEKSEGWGSRVKLSIADQIEKIKKGFVIRDPQGKTQSVNYLKTRANQDYVREVYLAKGGE